MSPRFIRTPDPMTAGTQPTVGVRPRWLHSRSVKLIPRRLPPGARSVLAEKRAIGSSMSSIPNCAAGASFLRLMSLEASSASRLEPRTSACRTLRVLRVRYGTRISDHGYLGGIQRASCRVVYAVAYSFHVGSLVSAVRISPVRKADARPTTVVTQRARQRLQSVRVKSVTIFRYAGLKTTVSVCVDASVLLEALVIRTTRLFVPRTAIATGPRESAHSLGSEVFATPLA